MTFRHIILFKFKPTVSYDDILNIFARLGELKHKIDGIITYSWGTNQWNLTKPNYDYCFVMDFDSKRARDNYQVDKNHVQIVDEMVNPAIFNATVFDYEI